MSYWINRIVIVYSSVNLRRLLFHNSNFDLSIEEKMMYSNAEAEFKDILYIEIDYTNKKSEIASVNQPYSQRIRVGQ